VGLLTFNALAASWIAEVLDRRGAARRRALAAAAVGIALAATVGFVALKSGTGRHARLYAFWQERAAVESGLEAACPGCGVLSFDDGIVSFSLPGRRTLNGLGLSMDAEAQRALSGGRLLPLAWERGHRLLVSVSYAMPEAAYASPESLAEHLAANRHLAAEDLSAWRFEPAFESPEAGVWFVRFEPAAPR
jgi:hypothetical protein